MGLRTTIITLYRMKWSVFITESENAYCAVRAGSTNIIQVNVRLESVVYNYSILTFSCNKGTDIAEHAAVYKCHRQKKQHVTGTENRPAHF